MPQNWTTNCFVPSNPVQTDMAAIEENFATIKSCFQGTSAPSGPSPGQLWFDSDDYIWKGRNAGDTAWYGLLHVDSEDQKFWVYRATAPDGWAIDSTSAVDRVLALKATPSAGGLYDTTAGTNAGETWDNLKAHVHPGESSHYHAGGAHTHTLVDSATLVSEYSPGGVSIVSGKLYSLYSDAGGGSYYLTSATTGTSSANNTGTPSSVGNTGAQNTSDVRPAAAIGTMQYLDLGY